MAGSMQSLERHAGPLGRLFDEYFHLVEAQTPAEKLTAFRLRGEVYSEYLGPDHFPDGLDRDEYDPVARHSLLYHRSTGVCAGTVRLICPPSADADGPWVFPMESIAGPHLGSARDILKGVPRARIGEISRFCLSRRFRGRSDESRWPDGAAEVDDNGVPAHEDRRSSLHPILGLMAGVMRLSVAADISVWYTFMEPRLYRWLQHFGVRFQPVGRKIDFYGTRQAYVAYLPHVLASMQLTHPDVWEFFTDGGRTFFTPCAVCRDALAELARVEEVDRAGALSSRQSGRYGGGRSSPHRLAS